jgi:hypothetical protein
MIDEVAMLSAFTFDLIENVLRKMSKVDKPFGGMQVR